MGNKYNNQRLIKSTPSTLTNLSSPQTQGVSKDDFQIYIKANDAVMKNMQNQMTNLTDMLTKFMNTNTASTSGSGSLPSNTVAIPRSDLKAITTRSGVSYDGPQVPLPPSFVPKVVEHELEVNRVDVIDVACEEYAQEVLGFLDISKKIEACLTSKSIPPGIDDADFDPKEDLLTLERLLNSDPSSTLPPEEQKFKELKTVEPSSDELPELELKDLPPFIIEY
ncbi:hypothetical protein Tco_1155595 [Tanacetum coccineum]